MAVRRLLQPSRLTRFKASITAISCLLCTSCGASKPADLETAVAALKRKDYLTVGSQTGRLLAAKADNLEARLLRAESESKQGHLNKAYEDFTTVLKYDANNPQALAYRAEMILDHPKEFAKQQTMALLDLTNVIDGWTLLFESAKRVDKDGNAHFDISHTPLYSSRTMPTARALVLALCLRSNFQESVHHTRVAIGDLNQIVGLGLADATCFRRRAALLKEIGDSAGEKADLAKAVQLEKKGLPQSERTIIEPEEEYLVKPAVEASSGDKKQS